MVLKYSSGLAFGLATIGLSLIIHPQFFSLEFISNIYALVMSKVGLPFLSASLIGS
jgi:hypothetical protein